MSQLSNNDKVVNDNASDAPQLCRSCFEFFGHKHNDFLCSKCFKEQCKTEQKAIDILPKVVPEEVNTHKDTAPNSEDCSRKTSVAEEEKTEPEVKEAAAVPEKPKESNKCMKCSKKVSVLGFKCKCGSTFCKAHRLPEDHDCEYDFKQEALAKLSKDNPLIMASKIQKI